MSAKLAAVLGFALAFQATPVIADGAELHTFHCLNGCPTGASAINDVVVREIYTLSSNDFTKQADWVAYRLTADTIGASGARAWRSDPWLADDETLEPDDYEGAFGAIGIDRGHQAPLAAFSGTPHAADTNILSNITPQASALNQASWQRLEASERALAKKEKIAVYVLTGPLFERVRPGLPRANERHRVPSGYWKVVSTIDRRTSAFIFDQDTLRSAQHCDMRVTIHDVEMRSRLDLFPRSAVNPTRSLDPELGCKSKG